MPADVTELRKLARDLRTTAALAPMRARVAVRKATFDIQRIAQSMVPVRTGNLKNSIGVEFENDGFTSLVGPTANYGAYVEYGTSKMAARPYMNPAAARVEPGFLKAMSQIGKL